MTVECRCIVKSIVLDYQSPERSRITDESDSRCLAVNACVCVCVLAVWQREGNEERQSGCACARRERTKRREPIYSVCFLFVDLIGSSEMMLRIS